MHSITNSSVRLVKMFADPTVSIFYCFVFGIDFNDLKYMYCIFLYFSSLTY